MPNRTVYFAEEEESYVEQRGESFSGYVRELVRKDMEGSA